MFLYFSLLKSESTHLLLFMGQEEQRGRAPAAPRRAASRRDSLSGEMSSHGWVALGCGGAMPVVTEKTEEQINMFGSHFFGMLLVMEDNEAFYPVYVSFFCLVCVTFVPQISLEAMDELL